MKKILLSILMLAAVATTALADSYHDTFVKYTAKSLKVYHEVFNMMDDTLRGKYSSPTDSATINTVLDYMEQQLMPDLLSELEPYYRKNVSEVELQEIMDWDATHPEYAAIRQRTDTFWFSQYGSQLLNTLQQELPKALKGEKVEAAKISKNVPKSYIKAFDAYVKSAIDAEYIESVSGALKTQLNALNLNVDKAMDEKTKALTEYCQKNARPLCINALYNAGVTESELQLMAERNNLPGAKNEKKVVTDMCGNLMEVGLNVVKRFMAWVEPRNPALSNRIQMALLMLATKLQAPESK